MKLTQKMKPIRILIVLGGTMKFGGTEAYLMNYYRHLDRSIIQYDFAQQGDKQVGVFDKEIKKLGGQVFYTPYKTKNPIKYAKQLYKIIKMNQYEIVYAHMDSMNFLPLLIARFAGVKIRISHSHNTQVQSDNKLKLLTNFLFRKLMFISANVFWACGIEAGNFLYGKQNKNVTIIKNAIDVDKYKYDSEIRNNIRKELNLIGKFVVGHVGRFSEQKNHKFIVKVFSMLLKVKSDARLCLVGDGELFEDIKQESAQQGILENILFLGNRIDCDRLYNCFDVLLFPSLFEGFSITLVEAQANGLPCILSNTISSENNILENINVVLSLESPLEEWVASILKVRNNNRENAYKELKKKEFDIQTESIKLQHKFLDLIIDL